MQNKKILLGKTLAGKIKQQDKFMSITIAYLDKFTYIYSNEIVTNKVVSRPFKSFVN